MENTTVTTAEAVTTQIPSAPATPKGKVLNAIGSIPMPTIVNCAVFVGITIFTAFILIHKTIQIHKKAKLMEQEEGAFTGNRTMVEDILRNQNYVGNATIFDTLDPITKDVAKDFNPVKKGKSKGSKEKKHLKKPTALKSKKDLADENAELREALRGVLCDERALVKKGWLNFGKATRDGGMAEIDNIARELGLSVDAYVADDDLPDEVVEKYGDVIL